MANLDAAILYLADRFGGPVGYTWIPVSDSYRLEFYLRGSKKVDTFGGPLPSYATATRVKRNSKELWLSLPDEVYDEAY